MKTEIKHQLYEENAYGYQFRDTDNLIKEDALRFESIRRPNHDLSQVLDLGAEVDLEVRLEAKTVGDFVFPLLILRSIRLNADAYANDPEPIDLESIDMNSDYDFWIAMELILDDLQFRLDLLRVEQAIETLRYLHNGQKQRSIASNRDLTNNVTTAIISPHLSGSPDDMF